MSNVNLETTKKLADLAMLDLSDEEMKTYTDQMADILTYIEKLSEVKIKVDGKEVEPMVHPHDHSLIFREDVAKTQMKNKDEKPKVLDSAPDVSFDGYKVPQVIGGEE